MAKKRYDDMIKVSQLNNSINDMYNKLYELELEGKKDSEHYKSFVNLIKFAIDKCDEYLLKYPLSDDYIANYVALLAEGNGYDPYEVYDYTLCVDNIKYKRLIDNLFELSLIHHDSEPKEQDNIGKSKIYFGDEEYDIDEGLEILEEMGYSQIADEFKEYQTMLNQDEYNESIDDYYLAKLELESHMFMLYLLEAINQEKDEEIKKALIKAKYNVIGQVKCLEKSFLYDNNLNIDLAYFKEKIDQIFESNNNLYIAYITSQEEIVRREQDKLLDRNKKSYKSIQDKVQDILLSLMIKSHISCVPNDAVKDALIEDLKAADELSQSKLDKKLIRRAIKINKKYEFNQKYN